MIRGLIRLNESQLAIDLSGFPAGSVAIGIDNLAGEAHRLTSINIALRQANEWLSAVESADQSAANAMVVSALLVFCTCFEGTSGHRQRPLRPKVIFTPSERIEFRGLLAARNKVVAHDDGLFPMNATVAVVGPDAKILTVATLAGRLDFPTMRWAHALRWLAAKAWVWTEAAASEEHNRLTRALGSMNRDVLERLVADEGQYVINIETRDVI